MFSSAGKNKTESRIVRIYWDDGLLDILAGVGVMLIGIAWLFELVPLGAIVPVVLTPFWKVARTRITEPRLGYAEFSDVQQSRNRNFLIISVAAGTLTFVLALGVYYAVTREWFEIKHGIAALPAVIVAALALMTAAATALRRFVLYAAILVAGGGAAALLGWEPGWSLLVGGAAIAIGGAMALFRFVLRYPLPADPEA